MVASIHFKLLLLDHLSPFTLKGYKFQIAVQQYALDMPENMHILGYLDYAYFVTCIFLTGVIMHILQNAYSQKRCDVCIFVYQLSTYSGRVGSKKMVWQMLHHNITIAIDAIKRMRKRAIASPVSSGSNFPLVVVCSVYYSYIASCPWSVSIQLRSDKACVGQ
jgi:hypothetical protein